MCIRDRAYIMSFFKIRGKGVIEILIIISMMSPNFIGAYSWILLLGRSGVVTQFLSNTCLLYTSRSRNVIVAAHAASREFERKAKSHERQAGISALAGARNRLSLIHI